MRGVSECLADAGITISASAENIEQVVSVMKAKRTCILITDPAIDEVVSFRACRLVKDQCATAKSVVLRSEPGQFDEVVDAYHVGIDAYLSMAVGCDGLVRAIAALNSGFQLLPAESLSLAANDFSLTPRERQIVRLLALESKDLEIAGELSVSKTTVHNYVRNIMIKMDVHSRQAIVRRARRRGLID